MHARIMIKARKHTAFELTEAYSEQSHPQHSPLAPAMCFLFSPFHFRKSTCPYLF